MTNDRTSGTHSSTARCPTNPIEVAPASSRFRRALAVEEAPVRSRAGRARRRDRSGRPCRLAAARDRRGDRRHSRRGRRRRARQRRDRRPRRLHGARGDTHRPSTLRRAGRLPLQRRPHEPHARPRDRDARGGRRRARCGHGRAGARRVRAAARRRWRLAKTRRYACVVALGAIVRGETPHFDYVASEAASGLQLAAIETGIPVAFGVLTVDTVEQGEARIDRAADAVRTAPRDGRRVRPASGQRPRQASPEPRRR